MFWECGHPANLLLLNKMKIDKDKKRIAKSDTQDSHSMELPTLKGLRTSILKLIFLHLSAIETVNMGLVNKEWLSISRDSMVWESHFKRDFPHTYHNNRNLLRNLTHLGPFRLIEPKKFPSRREEHWDEFYVHDVPEYINYTDYSFKGYWVMRQSLLSHQAKLIFEETSILMSKITTSISLSWIISLGLTNIFF